MSEAPITGQSAAQQATTSQYAAAFARLQETAKWLIAAGLAVAAAVAATVQVKGLDGLSVTQVFGAGLSALVGITLVVLAIAKAGGVITTPRPTIADLTYREMQAIGIRAKPQLGDVDDPHVAFILDQRSYLLEGHETINEYYRKFLESRSTRESAEQKYEALLLGSTDEAMITAGRDRWNLLVKRQSALQFGVERVEDASQLSQAHDRFQSLTRALKWGGALFVLAALAFGLFTRPDAAGVKISAPLPATVYIQDRAATGLPQSCHASVLRGFLIGGTFDNPEIVTEPAAMCASTIIKAGRGVVAVPTR